MINKNVDISSLKDIFDEYQENYSFVDSDFLKIYSYVTNNKVVAFLLFNIMYEKCEIVDILIYGRSAEFVYLKNIGIKE